MEAPPQADDEWVVHALNIHGTFFERALAESVARRQPWRVVDTQVPVEFLGAEGRRRETSELDILAEAPWAAGMIKLAIEAKKNNPELSRWVFFESQVRGTLAFRVLDAKGSGDSFPRWFVSSGLVAALVKGSPIVDEGREVRGTYQGVKDQQKTRTAHNFIDEAAQQVATAVQSLAADYARRWARRPQDPGASGPDRHSLYVPAIVTTATVTLCSFDPCSIPLTSGEIDQNKASLTDVPWVLYEFRLPRHLQVPPLDWAKALLGIEAHQAFNRMPIFVVQSAHVPEFLDNLRDWLIAPYALRFETALPEEVKGRM